MKNKRFIYKIFLLSSIFCIVSCNRNKYVVSEDKMVDVLYDIQLMYGYYSTPNAQNQTSNEQKKLLFDAILEKHKINQTILDSSLNWYSDHMNVYMIINDSVTSRLKRNQDLLNEQLRAEDAMLKQKEDGFPSFFYLTPEKPFFTFDIDSAKLVDLNINSVQYLSFGVLGLPSDMSLVYRFLYQYSDTLLVSGGSILAVNDTIDILHPERKNLLNFSGSIHAVSDFLQYKVLLYSLKLNRDSSYVERKRRIPLPLNQSRSSSLSPARINVEKTEPLVDSGDK
ncbi:MAG: DUF4296 domain-containing protein [Dysgonomonas sp.]